MSDRVTFWTSLADWIEGQIERAARRPLVVGLCAPQGAGKTTLTGEVCRMLAERGLRAVTVSIDDFYLTHDEQVALAKANPHNRFLRHRGLPGTHDIALGTNTLRTLKALEAGATIALPRYDRSAFSGQGDRRPKGEWPMVEGPLDAVIVEGWMLGFTPVAPDTIADPDFRTINQNLRAYGDWIVALDAFIWLEPEDYQFARTWRAEAEAKMIAEGRPGMTPAQVAAFVEPYLTGYDTYYPGLRLASPVDGPYLRVRIGADRMPMKDQP